MEIETLIELKCAIIVLPVLAKEFEEPLVGQLVATVLILLVV